MAFSRVRRTGGQVALVPTWGRRLLASLPMLAVAMTSCSSSVSSRPIGPRPADACTMLTSDQVAAIVGTPGPYSGAHEDPAEDGTPVWGCTWGTRRSFADLREISAAQFQQVSTHPSPTIVLTPLSGIGDKALLGKNKSNGSNSFVFFVTAGRYYEAKIALDRRGHLDAAGADRQASAGQVLAKTVVPGLSR